MSDDLADLPLKSLELPSKTVAKLKPLALETVAELYAVPLTRLVEMGLADRELAELAEAAPDFGVTWHSKEEVLAAAARASSATPSADASAPKKAQRKSKPARPGEKPTSRRRGSRAPLAPSPELVEALRPFCRILTLRAESIDGKERWYAVALVDLSRFPAARAAELEAHLLGLARRFADALESAGRASGKGHQVVGAAIVCPLLAKERGPVERLAQAHAKTIEATPIFAGPMPRPYLQAAASGLLAAHLYDPVIAMERELLESARGLRTKDALHALQYVADAYLGAGRAEEGFDHIRPLLTQSALEACPGSGQVLLSPAALCVAAGDRPLAVAVLRRAFRLDTTPTHLTPLRGEVLDDPRFVALHGDPSFKHLYKGFPAYEARLDRAAAGRAAPSKDSA